MGRFRDFLLPPLSFYEYLLLIGEVETFRIVPSLGKNALVQLPPKYHEKDYIINIRLTISIMVVFPKQFQLIRIINQTSN
ncbi:MAG: hypothetical protein R2883_06225 [Caldisericia bacterium]